MEKFNLLIVLIQAYLNACKDFHYFCNNFSLHLLADEIMAGDDLYEVYNIPNQHYIDFLKIGPYKKECGPLDSKTTNQMYFKNTGLSSNPSVMIGENETNKFWRND